MRVSESPIDGFLDELRAIPWFANLGQSLPAGANCRQIHDWEEWKGPEWPTVTDIGCRQQALFDELMSEGIADNRMDLWNRIRDFVLQTASRNVPYDANQDAWHGPTAAVWDAAWTAALIGLYRHLGRSAPRDVAEQWKWFVAGHWPCDWEGDMDDGEPIVF